jgi:hypothetical protein
VAQHRKPVPFKDVVEALKSSPPAATPSDPPGLYGERLVHPNGRTYVLTRDELLPAEAQTLAVAGAPVVWDSCACGGYCGLEWFDQNESRRMVSGGEPRIWKKNATETISEWRSSDGACLLLVSGDVRWGDLLG